MAQDNNIEQIITGCKQGDADCFSRLVDIYANRCYGYFFRLTGSRQVSDDLLSELFVKLVEKIRTYKGSCFEAWLFKIASNIFHDYLRAKQRNKKLIEIGREQLTEKIKVQGQSENEIYDKLQTNLEQLDADTRELIMLRFYSQLGFKEIARMRSQPLGTVLSKVHRGLKRLRELME